MLYTELLAPHAGRTEDGCFAVRTTLTLTLSPAIPPQLPTVISADARFVGAAAPTISYTLKKGGDPVYRSMAYTLAGSADFERHAWRVPPFVCGADTLELTIGIEEGTTAYIRALTSVVSGARVPWTGGMRLNAHLGFWGLCPDNTMPAFELAAACGYPACIVVPKPTKDGNLVCIHDDTINRTARDENGNPPTEPMYVWDMTLDELRAWEYGSYKHKVWRGVKIPTLEEFFALCAKTGMRPMFSTHPALTPEQWGQVKTLLEKYGLTKMFHVKSFGRDVLRAAWQTFGDSIEGYTYDVGSKNLDIEKKLADLAWTGIDKTRVRTGIEIPQAEMNAERAAAILAGGCFASVWNVWRITGERYRELLSMGVTEVTDDYNCSFGLNW